MNALVLSQRINYDASLTIFGCYTALESNTTLLNNKPLLSTESYSEGFVGDFKLRSKHSSTENE
jgi:hypothetical protein